MAEGRNLSEKELILQDFGRDSNLNGGEIYHTLRYDFKPASVNSEEPATLEVTPTGQVTIKAPNVGGSISSHTVFKGQRKPHMKECLLVIDNETGEMVLQKLTDSITVKATRGGGSGPPASGIGGNPTNQQATPTSNSTTNNTTTTTANTTTTTTTTTSTNSTTKMDGPQLSEESSSSSDSDDDDDDDDDDDGSNSSRSRSSSTSSSSSSNSSGSSSGNSGNSSPNTEGFTF